jgi:hypothetical protein
MSDDTPRFPAQIAITSLAATSATNDGELVASWVANLGSEHTRKNFGTTARRFLEALQAPRWRWLLRSPAPWRGAHSRQRRPRPRTPGRRRRRRRTLKTTRLFFPFASVRPASGVSYGRPTSKNGCTCTAAKRTLACGA